MMAIYRRILIPIDGSTTSECALQEALRLADPQSLLRLIYVLEEVFPLDGEGYAFIDYSALQEAVRQTGERTLAQAAEKARQSGTTAETALLDTSGKGIAHTIDDDARLWQADLIVIGTHGRSGLNRLLLGSVAEGVARSATVPVLLVHAG